MKSIHCVRNYFCALPLLVLNLCATTSQAQNIIMKDLTPALYPTLQTDSKHHNHFHIYMQPPKAVKVSNLETDQTVVVASSSSGSPLNSGSAKISPEIIKKVEQELKNFCIDSIRAYGNGGMDPGALVVDRLISSGILATDVALVRVTQTPQHGRLVANTAGVRYALPNAFSKEDSVVVSKPNFEYMPNKGFVGVDTASFEVKVNGRAFRVSYEIRVTDTLADFNCGMTEAEEDLLNQAPHQLLPDLEAQIAWSSVARVGRNEERITPYVNLIHQLFPKIRGG